VVLQSKGRSTAIKPEYRADTYLQFTKRKVFEENSIPEIVLFGDAWDDLEAFANGPHAKLWGEKEDNILVLTLNSPGDRYAWEDPTYKDQATWVQRLKDAVAAGVSVIIRRPQAMQITNESDATLATGEDALEHPYGKAIYDYYPPSKYVEVQVPGVTAPCRDNVGTHDIFDMHVEDFVNAALRTDRKPAVAAMNMLSTTTMTSDPYVQWLRRYAHIFGSRML
jgi:hypothetical protein